MAFFDHKKKTELYVDAGPFGCSCFLTQIHPNNIVKLVRCDSHAFTDIECRYSHIEKEAFACVWACKTCHIYIYGGHFTLITDALSVKKIFEEDKIRKRTPIRFIRWRSDLSVYNVTIVHREGSKNIADFLSRRFKGSIQASNIMMLSTKCTEARINRIVRDCCPTNISLTELTKATSEDAQIMEIKKALLTTSSLKTFNINKFFRNVFQELSVSEEGILLRNDLIVIPMELQQRVIDYAQEGHMGKQLCSRLLRNICWFLTWTP